MLEFFKNNKTLVFIIYGLLLITIIVGIYLFNHRKEKKSRNQEIKELVLVAVFSALSIILYFIKFRLPIFPEFLDIQFSNLPIFIGGFILGTNKGIIIVLIRTLLKLPFSSTLAIGELADMLIALTTVIVSSVIYAKNKTKKGGFIALVFGVITWVITAMIINWLILAPFYIALYWDGNEEVFIKMLAMYNADASDYMFKYIFYGILPFNLLLSTCVSAFTFITYKRISNIVK